ncbi:hypothetical protein FA95DRAFT_1551766 [Auriscalpium vulgare]|uniref:Uncharacterized protein n=1 Tax=Auriscalpium vulgare TaxID=40419 RepID=A0ACB8SBX9_9AGAM|nr:hypothetical protein FA95DRAFT_1551766 [Auriscalpium vulgare]
MPLRFRLSGAGTVGRPCVRWGTTSVASGANVIARTLLPHAASHSATLPPPLLCPEPLAPAYTDCVPPPAPRPPFHRPHFPHVQHNTHITATRRVANVRIMIRFAAMAFGYVLDGTLYSPCIILISPSYTNTSQTDCCLRSYSMASQGNKCHPSARSPARRFNLPRLHNLRDMNALSDRTSTDRYVLAPARGPGAYVILGAHGSSAWRTATPPDASCREWRTCLMMLII